MIPSREQAREASKCVIAMISYLHEENRDKFEDAAKILEAFADGRIGVVMGERRFPIQGGPSVPWSFMLPHNSMCEKNHSQSLERISERGGLSPEEAWAVVNGIEAKYISTNLQQFKENWFNLAEKINREALSHIKKPVEMMSRDEKLIDIIADKCMYDFPKGYSNSQVMAFQKGVDKVWSTIKSLISKLPADNKEKKE